MTVEKSEVNVARFIGNGAATSFSFNFPIYQSTDLEVTFTDAAGKDRILSASEYSVSVADYPGAGAVTYQPDGAAIPIGTKITIRRVLSIEQTTDLENQGGYYPDVLETALDHQTRTVAQLNEEMARSVKVPVSSDETPEDYLATIGQIKTDAQTAQSESEAARDESKLAASEAATKTANNVVATLSEHAAAASKSEAAAANSAATAKKSATTATTKASEADTARLAAEAAQAQAEAAQGNVEKIVGGSVTTEMIADGAITNSKLASDPVGLALVFGG